VWLRDSASRSLVFITRRMIERCCSVFGAHFRAVNGGKDLLHPPLFVQLIEGAQADLRVPDVAAAAAVDGGDFLRAWLSAVESRAGSLDPEILPVLKEARLSLGDRLIYKPFVEYAFNWFDFLQKGDSVLGKAESGEIFADYEEEKQVWIELSDAIAKRFGEADLSLNVLLQEIDLSPKQAIAPANAVRCYTIHTAKGMEFDHVFLVGMAEDILPSYQSIKKGPTSREMQEERRSCFVAITRVRCSLHLTYARRYFGYEKSPSRFLKEMGLATQ